MIKWRKSFTIIFNTKREPTWVDAEDGMASGGLNQRFDFNKFGFNKEER